MAYDSGVQGTRRARGRDRSGLIGVGAIWGLLGLAMGLTDFFPAFQQLGYAMLVVGAGITLTGILLTLRDRRGAAQDRHRAAHNPDGDGGQRDVK
jgi:putative exporter of polyketide antibiotics